MLKKPIYYIMGGGALFGVGAMFTGGCASRTLIRTAEGNIGALLTLMAFAIAGMATASQAASRAEARTSWKLARGWAGSLRTRAPVTMSGVTIGRVTEVADSRVDHRVGAVAGTREELAAVTEESGLTPEAAKELRIAGWVDADLAAIDDAWRNRRDEIDHSAEQIVEADSIAIIGGGATGVSVAANVRERYPDKTVHFFYSEPQPLPGYHPKARQRIVEHLERAALVVPDAVHNGDIFIVGQGSESRAPEVVEFMVNEDGGVWCDRLIFRLRGASATGPSVRKSR